MDLVTVLQHVQSPDANIRNQAEAYLNNATETQYEQFILALCVEFAGDGKLDSNRQLAGLYLKNLITAKDAQIFEAKKNKWLKSDPATKEQIRVGCIQSLQNANKVVRHTAAQIIAAFGAVDIPINEWPALVPALLTNVLNADIAQGTKVASLEALGYLCENLDSSQIPNALSNQILSAIINGLRPDLANEIRLAAVNALINSLVFTSANFDVDVERDAIMKTVCETTQCTDITVREKAFECLARIADLYYDKLANYVTAIFQLTTTAIKTDEESVGIQAIEFWLTVCDCEINVIDDHEQGITDIALLNIVEQAAPSLIPFLLEAMTKQADELEDADTFNIAVAATSCIDAISKTIQDKVTDLVMPFITSNIQNTNWHFKEAAIMCFGSILEGPSEEKLGPVVTQALPVLIACLQDQSVHVRDTTAWTLAKICEWHKRAITTELLQPLINGLMSGLEDKHPKVVAQVSYAINNLAEACGEDRDSSSNLISHFMGSMLEKLFAVANRPDGDDDNLQASAYEAVNMIVHNSALDMRPMVLQVLNEAISRLNLTFTAQTHVKAKMNLQSSQCGLIGECVQKLDKELILPLSDQIMQLLLQVLTSKGAAAHEDAFLSISYMVDKLEVDFRRYVPHVVPYVLEGLRNYEEYSVCICALGVVGDLCRNVGQDILGHCDNIMKCLFDALQSSTLDKSVKPHAISSFGDIALAIEGNFEKYIQVVMRLLTQAGSITIDTDDEDLIEYINSLHESIYEAYTGILLGLKAGHKQEYLLSAVDSMIEFMERTTSNEQKSDAIVKVALGLLGDIAQTFRKKVIHIFKRPFVNTLIQEGLSDEDIRENAAYAQHTIMGVMQSPS